jgi:hypothetical protein
LHVNEQQSASASQGWPLSRQQRCPLVPGMAAARQLPMQQSLSLSQAHWPVLQRLLRAAVHDSLAGAAHVPPPSMPPNVPASPGDELQLPVQQSLLFVHGSPRLAQHGVLTVVSHTAPFWPAGGGGLPLPVLVVSHGSPVAAIESKPRPKQTTRRFMTTEA